MRFADRVAVITAGASGIGRATADIMRAKAASRSSSTSARAGSTRRRRSSREQQRRQQIGV